MKVLILNSLYYPNIIGGAERSVQIIAENMIRAGIDTVVASVSDRDYIDYINGVKSYYVYHSNLYWSYYSKEKTVFLKPFWHLLSIYNYFILKRVKKIIKEEGPDIIHTNNLSEFTPGVWKLARRMKIPVVHTLRDYSLLCPKASLFKGNNNCSRKYMVCRLLQLFKRYYSRYVDAVAGNSDFILKKHIDSGFFKNSISYVVYNSFDQKNQVNRKTTGNKIRFGFMGQLSSYKGIELLFGIFKDIKDAKLNVFGKAQTYEYGKYLESRYASDQIKFHGFVNTENAMEMIDVLIVPSIWDDPLPRVIYEAYFYGIPVIGSKRGGIPEIIDIGKTGFIFNPDEKEEFKKIIYYFLNNPGIINQMKPYCFEKAKEFLPEKTIKGYINVYKVAMNKI
jgi:glycosyltransferase involved in cell wall biosynthesis